MTRPRFLELGPAEMSEFRSSAMGEILLEWLLWERARNSEIVMETVVKGGTDAQVRAGATLAFDHIIRALTTPFAIAELDDEEYEDPATRPSLRKVKNAPEAR